MSLDEGVRQQLELRTMTLDDEEDIGEWWKIEDIGEWWKIADVVLCETCELAFVNKLIEMSAQFVGVTVTKLPVREELGRGTDKSAPTSETHN
jgi:hypothetical protein